jgi:NAD(P)H-flavin reductase
MSDNPMKPYLGKLVAVKDLAAEIKLFRIEMQDGGREAFHTYEPGQFAFVSAFGLGEAPFGIANTPQRGPYLDFAVARLGSVTTSLHELGEGDIVGVRGPLGNWFPMDRFQGMNLIVLGGGIGGAPLRPVIQYVLDHRADYGHLSILWAARNPSLLVFTDEYDEWRAAKDTDLHLTVDQADEKWDQNVGLITQLLEKEIGRASCRERV